MQYFLSFSPMFTVVDGISHQLYIVLCSVHLNGTFSPAVSPNVDHNPLTHEHNSQHPQHPQREIRERENCAATCAWECWRTLVRMLDVATQPEQSDSGHRTAVARDSFVRETCLQLIRLSAHIVRTSRIAHLARSPFAPPLRVLGNLGHQHTQTDRIWYYIVHYILYIMYLLRVAT